MVYQVKISYKKPDKNSKIRKRFTVYAEDEDEAIKKVTSCVKIKDDIKVHGNKNDAIFNLYDITAKKIIIEESSYNKGGTFSQKIFKEKGNTTTIRKRPQRQYREGRIISEVLRPCDY